MNIQNKKILVTGGGSGIGLAIATAFSAKNNQLILVGRNEEKLKAAAAGLPRASYVVADVASEKDVNNLVKQVKEVYGGIDILVNNAGVATAHPLSSDSGIYENAKYEMEINYFAVLRLTEQLMPFLKQSKEAAIVNIESIVSYIPSVVITTYSATKAALHFYSQALRLVLQRTNPHIKLFEVFPPYVDTDLTKSFENVEKLTPSVIANDLLSCMEKDEYAVRSGRTNDLYQLFRQSPEEAFLAMNNR